MLLTMNIQYKLGTLLNPPAPIFLIAIISDKNQSYVQFYIHPPPPNHFYTFGKITYNSFSS